MKKIKINNGVVVLAIPQVPLGENYHPGGQLTAANGLIDFLNRREIRYEILNTVATSFPPVPLWKKFLQSIHRVWKAWLMAANDDVVGYIAFSGFGLSFYERCFIALVFKLNNKPSVIFFRSTEIIGQAISASKRRFLSSLLNIPSGVVSQSTLLAKELQRLGRKSVVVIPNWLPTGYTIATYPKAYPTTGIVEFVFVGWLERRKGIPELLDAVASLQPMVKRFRLHLVGNGRLEAEVSDAIATRGLDNIFPYGWLNQTNVIDILDRSHVLVLPSHSEGFPNALLESIAKGLPVIATKVGGIPESITHNFNGMLVDVGDTDGIAAAMRHYIEKPDLIPTHSQQAIIRAQQLHDREVNCERLINLLSIYKRS